MGTPILATIGSGLMALATWVAIGLAMGLGTFTSYKFVEGVHTRISTWALKRKREKDHQAAKKELAPAT